MTTETNPIDEITAAPFQPILRVFREVLKPSTEAAKEQITPSWCTRIMSQYPGISYADMPAVRDRYYGLIEELKKVIDHEIDANPEALQVPDLETDMEENREVYLNVILGWQMALLEHELEWDCTNPEAAAEVAAISEVHKMFFGQNGITEFLHQSNFEFTESDQGLITEALDALRGGDVE